MEVIKIAVFASGTGTNAEKLIDFFSLHPFIKVALVVSNRKSAGVLEMAKSKNVEALHIPKDRLYDSNHVSTLLISKSVSWVVLAGFLLKVPASILESYPDRVINVHPSLLPKFGGKGMYGMHVHNAVYEAGETETGITIHLVNSEYDKGLILKQVKCPITPLDNPESIQQKVQILEHAHFANTIAQEIQRTLNPLT